MKLRKLANGILIAPTRGKPPIPPEGYEPDAGNPYILRPKLLPCVHREMKQPTIKCCNNAVWMYCQIFKKRVSRATCMGCDEAIS